MPHPIEMLLRAKYDKNFTPLEKLKITIKHHTKTSNTKEIRGSEITEVTKNYIIINSMFIPKHRIIKVEKINQE